ncbi:MAG: bifunctional phosphoglucose/phosphomannose isomerase [Chloroflexi bacterium RBG_13_48_17]|nr:MAG: bifunctional phosphoglucose/phosphomannose isomerase [Chloroflexi bacterium RBG_13_48_17]
MVNLDDMQVYKRLDPANMMEHLHGLPRQCRTAWLKAQEFQLPKGYANIDKVVVLGMGGSAIGGSLLRNLASRLTKPVIFVTRDYDLPAFIDDRTLVIASSYSGNTEETLSAFSQAVKSKCKKLAMTTGGKLKTLAEEAKVPVFLIDHASQPRAALGYSFIPLIAFLQKLGFLKDKTTEVEAMIQDLERLLEELHETVPTSSNPAKQLSAKLQGKIAVIYGAGILSAVARRWKTQINENSKAWAFYETFPELNHNAVAGYQFPSELASKMYVVLLRCPSLHSRTLIRYQVTSELLKQNNISHEVIDSQNKGELSQMMSLIYLGDWVSYYLAILNDTDPTPVKVIEQLKKRLSDTK